MLNRFHRLLDSVPSLIENTHVKVFLEGWPAAFSIASACGALVALASIFVESRRSA